MSVFWETLHLLIKAHDTLLPERGKRGNEKEEAKYKEEKREMRYFSEI